MDSRLDEIRKRAESPSLIFNSADAHTALHEDLPFLMKLLGELFTENEKLRDALVSAVMRETRDPNHNWLTCSEPSCFMARKVLGEPKRAGV